MGAAPSSKEPKWEQRQAARSLSGNLQMVRVFRRLLKPLDEPGCGGFGSFVCLFVVCSFEIRPLQRPLASTEIENACRHQRLPTLRNRCCTARSVGQPRYKEP